MKNQKDEITNANANAKSGALIAETPLVVELAFAAEGGLAVAAVAAATKGLVVEEGGDGGSSNV